MTRTELEGARRPETTDGWGPWAIPLALLVGSAIVLGLVLRFTTRSPLWLDEALSVNIARLPLGDISEALRHDGHPPLYYVLLHGWMDVFGEGNAAVRAFSGIWGVLTLPLLYIAGRRFGGRRVGLYAVAILVLSPYAVRYATETRMYAMEMVLALVGWLLVDDALRSPRWWRLGLIAVVVGALLWTHYWAMWFLLAGGVGLLVHARRAHRRGDEADRKAALLVAGAIAAGGVLFLPWVPALLYQGAHTGTPWARPVRPTEMVTFTLADMGGGPQAEAIILGWAIAALAVLGLFGRGLDRSRVELDLRTRPLGRPLAILIVGTLAVANLVGYATGATYASRYAAIFVPFLVILAAVGLDQIRSRAVVVGVVAGLLLFGGVGSVRNAVHDRSDARQSADAITAKAKPGDIVVYCPDQLGPATSRVLGDADVEQVTYPAFAAPQRVDWVDYKERLDKADPERFAQQLLERAGRHQIFYVFDIGYTTHKESCAAIYNALGQQRPPELLTEPSDAYEPATVALYPAPAP